VLLLLGLGLITIAECRNLNLKNLRRKRASLRIETERREVCIEDLGCYPDTNPGVEEEWSFSSLMQASEDNLMRDYRDTIATEFRWWAPGAQEARVTKHREVMDVAEFDPSLKVKFLVHGYWGGNAEWATAMKDAFMRKEQCNVFIVDWSNGAAAMLYSTAVANTWVVGAELGNFIVQLVEKTGVHVEDIHIIGHSLGAHVSGYAGKWVKNKLQKPVGRITGLDPAGPEFYDQIPGERLNMGDAAFVDVIHTNWAEYRTAGLGLFKAVGHFDFYPNGGEDQPGCMTQTEAFFSMSEDMADKFSCSHSRAILLFTESIESDSCKFLADQCTTWEEYQEGKCPSGKEGTLRVPMGYHADEYRQSINEEEHKSFFLETNGEPPYCKAK